MAPFRSSAMSRMVKPSGRAFLRLNTYTRYALAYSRYSQERDRAIPFTVRRPSPRPGMSKSASSPLPKDTKSVPLTVPFFAP